MYVTSERHKVSTSKCAAISEICPDGSPISFGASLLAGAARLFVPLRGEALFSVVTLLHLPPTPTSPWLPFRATIARLLNLQLQNRQYG